MARVIKFRAWHTDREQMYTVDYLGWNARGCVDDVGLAEDDAMTTPDNVILLQFTGLLDRHGTEIFEGDVLEVTHESGDIERCEVRFSDGGFIVEADFGESDLLTVGWALLEWQNEPADDVKVIGNIYEHPELTR